MVNQWTRKILLVLSNLILMNLSTKKMRTFIGARKQKSKDVLLNEISLSSTHKFDLNKPYFEEEEEIHSNEAMEQQVSNSENVSSTNKMNLSTTRNFNHNKLPPKEEMDEALMKMLKLLIPGYFRVWVIFKISWWYYWQSNYVL